MRTKIILFLLLASVSHAVKVSNDPKTQLQYDAQYAKNMQQLFPEKRAKIYWKLQQSFAELYLMLFYSGRF